MFIKMAASWLAALASCVATLACQGSPTTSGNTLAECRALTASSATRSPDWSGTVFTIVMENHSYDDIIGAPEAPYINALANQNAVAAGYHDPFIHPSKPNYIWMAAGQNFGILDNRDPGPGGIINSNAHLADQIELAGLTWKTYQESMGAPCGLRSHGAYAVKHDPFAYFADINGWDGTQFQPSRRCDEHIVDYGDFASDLAAGTLPNYVFITPNLNDDMHDGTVAAGDLWLSREVPGILDSDAYQRGGALFLFWDEGSNQGDEPPFIAISPNARHGFVSATAYDTSSYLATVQGMLGLESLPCSPESDAVATMDDLFTVGIPKRHAADAGEPTAIVR